MTRPDAMPATLDRLGRRQMGLVTRDQLARAGLGGQAVDRRVADGRLLRVRRRVYRLPGAPVSWEQCVLAAVLAGPPGAVASHTTAAQLHRLRGIESDLIELTASRPGRLDGLIVHTRARLDAHDRTRIAGIPVTTVARTLCDLSGRVPSSALARALDEALRCDQTTLKALTRCVGTLTVGRGPRGLGPRRLGPIHQLLVERADGPRLGKSALESKVLRWLREAGLPDPATQYRVKLGRRAAYRFDLAYPDLRIAIEPMGWYEHGKRSAFEPDLSRRNDIEVAGWMILEFGDQHRRREVVETVLAARAAQTAALQQLANLTAGPSTGGWVKPLGNPPPPPPASA